MQTTVRANTHHALGWRANTASVVERIVQRHWWGLVSRDIFCEPTERDVDTAWGVKAALLSNVTAQVGRRGVGQLDMHVVRLISEFSDRAVGCRDNPPRGDQLGSAQAYIWMLGLCVNSPPFGHE